MIQLFNDVRSAPASLCKLSVMYEYVLLLKEPLTGTFLLPSLSAPLPWKDITKQEFSLAKI